MQLVLARILLLQIFLSCCGFATTVNAEGFDQFKLDIMLAKRGDPVEQFYLGGDYEEGRGVHKNLVKAFEWYSIAAKNGHNGAQFKLGEFYENGLGIKVDKKKALFWYKKAERNGSRLAKEYLSKLEANKRVEASAKVKEEIKRKRRLANEQAKKREKQRHLAAEKVRQARQIRARKAARQRKLAMAKPIGVVTMPASSNTKKLSAKDRTALIAKYIKVLLNNKWHAKTIPAELLPSSLNNCLKSSEKELVCFSRKQHIIIKNSQLTFTSKSIINDFNYNGDFSIRYYFNVLDVRDASASGESSDPLGLRVEKGWQEPEQSMNCNISNKKKLKCVHNGQNFYFQP